MISTSSEERWISAVSEAGPWGILVDGDGPEDDGMYAGVYLRSGHREFSGGYLHKRAPLIAPERPFTIQSWIHVVAGENRVDVSMVDDGHPSGVASGRYRLQQPLRMDATVSFGPHITIVLRGLYYILPSGVGTVSLRDGEGKRWEHGIVPGPWRTYFEDIRTMEFFDSFGTHFLIETEARVLQLEGLPAAGDPAGQAFEIDFDHSYKEYGQFEIFTTVRLSP